MKTPFSYLCSAVLLLACTPAPTKPPSGSASSSPSGLRLQTDAAISIPIPAGERKPFAIAFVVDQHASWIAEERWKTLPESGGFARLQREGTWVKQLRLPYSVTDTAPGHAALHTGKVPADSGIWGNELPDATGPFNGRMTFLRDPNARVVVPNEGVREAALGSSPARLKVDTVADRLRAAHKDALIVSISLKDRGAIIPAGKQPSHAIWFESHLGTFVTSTAFEKSFPSWGAPIADAKAIAKMKGMEWTLSKPEWIKENARVVDDAPGEGDLEGFGTTFPHSIKGAQSFRASPMGDNVIFELALAAMKAEYDPRKPTLLLLSMSPFDVIGHVFGPDSWEAWDELYKLDAALGRFLVDLEKVIGTKDYGLVLSADHGTGPMPETAKLWIEKDTYCKVAKDPPAFDRMDRPKCHYGKRFEPIQLQKLLKDEALKQLGAGDWILGVADPYVFLGKDGKASSGDMRKKLDTLVIATLKQQDIREVHDVRVLEAKCPAVLEHAQKIPNRAWNSNEENHETLVCRSWPPNGGAGDFFMVAQRGEFFDGELTPGKGGSHGSPSLHDRTVPFLMRGKGVNAAHVIEEPTDFTAYSEVLAAMMGLTIEKTPADIVNALRASPPKR